MAASDGSGWSIQDIEHCRRWNRVPECVVGEGWKGGDMAGILSQGLKSLFSRRPLSETYSVRNVLDSYGDTPVCEAAYPTRGHRETDSLFAALKLSFKQQLEKGPSSQSYVWFFQ